MSTDARIITEVDGHIATVTVHQPARRNAVSLAMWQQLDATLVDLARRDIRVVVVTGAGDRAFSAGADISEFATLRATPEQAQAQEHVSGDALTRLRDFPAPTIARIRGVCIGGGMELALACDIRLAADDARFAVTPGRLGLGYGLRETSLLVERLGASAVREILFTARMFDAADALRLGIVNAVETVDRLDELVTTYTDDIAANAPLTVAAAKRIIAEAERAEAERDAALCEALVRQCNDSSDFREGQAAFADKRRPRFTGR